MRSIAVGALAATALLVAGCASPGADAPTAPATPGSLTELPMPSPAGEVLGVGTVLGSAGELDGDQPVFCLGFVAESAPPQCHGPALLGWDWDAFEHEESGGVRWVQGVALTGVYEQAANTFTVLGEPMSAAAITLPAVEVPDGVLDEARGAEVQTEIAALDRQDFQGAWFERGTVVWIVTYDDGSLQAAADAYYGEDAVLVSSALHDTGEAADEPPLMEPPLDTARPVITDTELSAWLAELPRPSTADPVVALGTVLESSGEGAFADAMPAGVPMLCQMVLTSYPPQCGGPEVVGWDWDAVEHEAASGVRWTNDIAMRLTYDGASRTVTLLEIVDSSESQYELPPQHTSGLDAATLEQLQRALIELERDDFLMVGGSQIEVLYDDGSIQAAFDARFGEGNVQVTSWLR